ncbi:hypothetical protein KY290_003814 [Solanum tuberosum]|uniref:SWIM-type domain-containing protein n=1 Tax=Solanum tuberosum TaxID=4113 RepID=A0ABQ7WVD6_SOLTU|nr:hypothetical protein KY290_003814 [Solanum tuberosum]
MKVAEFVVAGGDYMGVWEETPKSWYWKSFTKTIVPIALRRNGSYDDMIASVIEADELACEPGNLVISYKINGRVKIHPTFIKNDRHVSLYMIDIVADGSRPILRINVIARSSIEPMNSLNDNDSIENENLDQPIDAEDVEHFEEDQEEPKLRSQPSHSFSNGTNFYMYQTFSTKSELQLLLAEAEAGRSFDFAKIKSCSKYLKVKCVSRICVWMLRAKKYECSDRFRIYKYIGDHSCGVEHAISSHRKLSTKVIVSLCVNLYHDGKGVSAKEMVRGTAEHGYSCLLAFSFMFDTLNVGSSYCIMVSGDTHRFTYYVLAFGACIKGFSHMRKVIAVDDTYLHENDASWTFFFEKLKDILVDESDLSFISDRHKSIANGFAKVYNHAHHGYFRRHLGENLCISHQCGDSLYLYYNAAKAYCLKEFNDHFLEFKDKSPEAAFVLEHDIGFEKWSKAHFTGNMYNVMTTNIADSLNAMLIDEREYPVASIINSIAKRFGELFRERHAYVLKSKGSTSTVNLLEKSCSCREYDLVKISCAHAMAALRSKHGDEYGMTIYEYSSPLYKAETYLLVYSESINVVHIESEWCVPKELLSVNILPPLVDTNLERKKRKRVKGVSENFKSKRRNKCSICKRFGHKKTTCMNNNKS